MAEKDKLEKAIRALEAQRSAIGNSVVDTATAELREKIAALGALQSDRRQLVSVLFADVSGFTALSERLDPEDVQALLARLWPRLDRVIRAHRGHIDKHIGDAVMAVWGLSDSSAEDAVDAVRAGLGMLRELEAFRIAENVTLAMRVGINTGLASVSRVESTGEWNVIGDTVNLASRLEHAAEVGSVLIGSNTREHVRDRFELGALAPLTVKGKKDPVRAFRVLRELSAASSGTETETIPFLGRDRELSALVRLFDRAAAGGLACVTLTGDAGAGKSRLMRELASAVMRQGGRPRVVTLRPGPHSRRAAFWALGALLTELSSKPRDAPLTEHAESALVAALGAERGAEACAYLGAILGFSDAADQARLAPLAHHPEQIRGRAEVLLCECLAHASAERMLLLGIDPLEELDAGSLGFFQRLRSRGLPRALLVAAARPGGPEIDGAAKIELSPLSSEDCQRLAAGLVPDEALARLVARRCGGNPSFLLELARWAEERAGQPLSELEAGVPPRVEQVLAERFARLPETERAVLGAASVLGAPATLAELSAMLGIDPSVALRALEGEAMLVGDPQHAAWVPASALLGDVVYEHSLLRDRRTWHERAARLLAARPGSEPQNTARHFEAAGLTEDAIIRYVEAGERARLADATDTALECYRHALELGAKAALAIRAHLGLGRVHEARGEYDESVAAFERAALSAQLHGDARGQASAHDGRSWASSQRGDHEEAVSAAQRAEEVIRSALALSRAPDLLGELAEAEHNQGWALCMLGRADEALALGRRALSCAEAASSPRERALALNLIGVVLYHLQGRFEDGARHQEAALSLYRELGDRWGIACQLNNLGDLERARGNFAAARAFLEQGLVAVREIGHIGQEVVLLGNLGRTKLAAGDSAGARVDLQASIALAERSGAGSFTLSESTRVLAEVAHALDEPRDALRLAQRALTLANSDPADTAAAFRTLGVLLSAEPDPEPVVYDGRPLDAEECFARSLQGFTALGVASEQIATYEAWARHEQSRGASERSFDLQAQAARLRDSVGG